MADVIEVVRLTNMIEELDRVDLYRSSDGDGAGGPIEETDDLFVKKNARLDRAMMSASQEALQLRR